MLSTETLDRIYPLAQQLDSQRRALVPAQSTPLEGLVIAGRTDARFMTYDKGTNQYNASMSDIAYMANALPDGEERSEHDKAMDEIVMVCKPAVQAQIRTIKTVVSPAVKELAEKTAEALATMTPSSLLGLEVCVYTAPQLLRNNALEKDLRRLENVPFSNPLLMLDLPVQSGPELLKLMETGSSSIDNQVADWAAAKGETFFNKVWMEVFQTQQAELNETRVRTLRDYLDDAECGADYSLAIYLLANRLWDNPLEGVRMKLSAYEDVLVGFRDQAALSILRYMEQLEQQKKSGILIRSIDNHVTVVNAEIYNDWLEKGGSNEILFGNMLSSPSYVTVSDLDEQKATLLAGWHKHEIMTKLAESAKRFERTKSVMLSVFGDQLGAAQEDEFVSDDVRQRVRDLFREELALTTEQEMDNLYMLALRLLCKSRFIKTDAYAFLSAFNRIKADNPNASDDEVAAVVTIRYVAGYMASQIQVVAF